MRKLYLLLGLLALLLTACENQDLVSDSAVLEHVTIAKLSTESCGKNCTNYMVTLQESGVKTKYEAEHDLYRSIEDYRDSLKAVTGSTETSYTAIVLQGDKKILAIVPKTKVVSEEVN